MGHSVWFTFCCCCFIFSVDDVWVCFLHYMWSLCIWSIMEFVDWFVFFLVYHMCISGEYLALNHIYCGKFTDGQRSIDVNYVASFVMLCGNVLTHLNVPHDRVPFFIGSIKIHTSGALASMYVLYIYKLEQN